MLINTTSLSIILRQYKEGNLSEEEATQLIEDLYSRNDYVPNYPINQPGIIWIHNFQMFQSMK